MNIKNYKHSTFTCTFLLLYHYTLQIKENGAITTTYNRLIDVTDSYLPGIEVDCTNSCGWVRVMLDCYFEILREESGDPKVNTIILFCSL